ncbi:SNF2 domain-containing protein CLASSY 4-like isoform X1 [Punica granatum]|uniref:SNF2 domain-containing protein CLASSY 4-like isoform X1 n=1 Tax=Punica granatum TaxID=22663 RepID=A0A6P8DFF1_PUNGR|nr:SNF2 domain-containing protein CLASSY 4-like isoform X1 [Punica granatum]
MEFTYPVARRTRFQKGKLSTASSSRVSEMKKGGTFPSNTKATGASSSSTAKKSRIPTDVARPGDRGKRPRLGRNRSEDRDYEVISLGDSSDTSDDDNGLDVGFGSGGSSDLRAGAMHDREMHERRSGGEEDDYSVIHLGPSSSDDEEEGEERLPETNLGSDEYETSAESEAADSDDEGFGLSSESEEETTGDEGTESRDYIVRQHEKASKERKRGGPRAQQEEETTGDEETESDVEIVRQSEKAGKERKRGRPRAQQEETAGSSRRGGPRSHGPRSNQVDDVEVISLGSSDTDDMDDFPDVFAGAPVPGAVASRTRSKMGPRMSVRGATGPGHASFSSCHLKMREKEIALGPLKKDAPKMKKGEGKRKSEGDSRGSDHSSKKNGVEREKEIALGPLKKDAPKMKKEEGERKSERDSGGCDHSLKNGVEKQKEIALGPLKKDAPKMKKGEGERKSERDSGGWDHSSKKNGVEKEKVIALGPLKKDAPKMKKGEGERKSERDSGGWAERDSDVLSSSKAPPKQQLHSMKKEGVERKSDILSSSMGPPKKQEAAPDIRESENSAGDDENSDSCSSDHASNTVVEESKASDTVVEERKASDTVVEERKAPARKMITRKSDFFKILAESIWKKDGRIGDECQQQQQVRELLPVKFSWFDDEKPVEKSEYEKEMDYMWNMMNLGLQADQIGSYSPRNEDTDADDTELETSQAALCRQGKHVLILEEQVGQRCRYCSHIAVEIDDYYAPFENFPSETQHRGYHRGKDAATLDALHFQAPENCCADYLGPIDSGTVWDLIPGARNQMYPHQREGFEFMWRNLAGSIILDELRSCSLQKEKDIGGCIISHAPGTGKTRLTLVFLQAYLEFFSDSRPVIIAPASLLLTWEDEIKKWGVGVPFHNLNAELSGKEDTEALKMLDCHRLSRNIDSIRMMKLYSWSKSKSILIVSYEMFVKLTKESERTEQMRKILLELPGLVILDEGHIPRNRESDVWNQIIRLKTKKRVILSGTPFQNNFDELHNTLYVVRPKIAESIPRHLKRFCQRGTSIHFNGDPDEVIDEMKAIMAPFVHLHKGDILHKNLPGLRDSVVVLNPSELQVEVMRIIHGAEDDSETAKKKRKDNVFDFEHKQALISVHPSLALSFEPEERLVISREEEKLEARKLDPGEGVKTRFIVEFLRLCLTMGEKVLIFSQYIKPLDLIALQLSSSFKWTMGREVLMMIGKLRMNQRQSMIDLFNQPESEARVLLASTKACSEGINLVGASRVILLDVVWNPAVERQAISRAYRLGQKRVVYTYHLIMKGTSEWEKYQKQAHKDRLSELVFSATTSNGDKNEKKSGVVFDDKILEELTSHPKLRDLFDQIRYQPKQMDLVENFGPNN